MTLGLALLRHNGKSDELGHPLGSELSRPIRSRQETDASFPEKPGVTHLSTVRCNTMTIRGPCESKCDSFLTATKPNCPHSTKVLTQLSGVSAGRNGGSAHQRSSSAMERRRRLWKRSQLRPELQTGAPPFNDHLLSTGGPTSNGQNGSSPSLMRDYVANLKEQIQCLENELAHVKQSMSAVNDKSQPVAREGCAQCNATSMHLCKHKSDTSATTRLRKIVADASDTVHLSVPTCRAMHCITEGVFNCEVIDMELRKLKASYALREVHHEQFVSELRAQLEKTKTELQESQSSVVTRAEQIATQRIELLEQIHVDQRNATMQSLTEVKQQLAAVVLDAKRQQMETERLVATRQGLAEELTRWKKTAHEYEGELDVLRAEIRVLQSQVRDKNMAIEQTEATRSESITAHLNQTQREHEAPHAEWDRRALEREKAHQVHVESLEERVRTLTAQLHETRLSAERADVTVRHLETRLAQLSASDAEKDLLIETIKEATHTLKQEHLQLENALENSERRVEEWAVKYRQCAERLVHTQATLDQLKQDRRERWCTEDAMDVERQEWREERQALLQKLSAAQAERDGSHKAQSTALARVERLEVEDSVLRKEMHHYRQENALLQDELAKAHELLHRLSGTHKAFDLLKNLEDTRSGLQEVLSTQLRLGGEMVASLDKFPPIQTVVPLSLTDSSTPDKINVTTSVSGLHVDAVQPAPQLTLPSNVPYTTDSSNTRAVVPPTLDEGHSNHNEKRVSRTAVECDRPSADVTIQSIDLS